MSESGSGSYGHVSGGDSPSDSEDEDGVVRHDRLVGPGRSTHQILVVARTKS